MAGGPSYVKTIAWWIPAPRTPLTYRYKYGKVSIETIMSVPSVVSDIQSGALFGFCGMDVSWAGPGQEGQCPGHRARRLDI